MKLLLLVLLASPASAAVVRSSSTITINNAGLGLRTYQTTMTAVDVGAGNCVSVSIRNDSSGASPPVAPDSFQISYRIGDNQTVIATTVLSNSAAQQNNTFCFTSDGTAGTAHRAGTVRLRLSAVKDSGLGTNQYNVNSDDAVGEILCTGCTVDRRDQGWARSTTTASVVVSTTSGISSAFTGTYAYPDTIYQRVTLGARAYTTTYTVTLAMLNAGGGVILSSAVSDVSANGVYIATYTQAADTAFTEALTVNSATTTATFVTGLTGIGFTTFSAVAQSVTVDPRVNPASLASTSGGLSKVYNRVEMASGTITIRNARGEGFAPKGFHTFYSISNAGEVENLMSRSTPTVANGGAATWYSTFTATGNIAPLTSAGISKHLRWRDTTTTGGTTNSSNSPQPVITSTYAFLSSSYSATAHIQIGIALFYPALYDNTRQVTDIGFYAIRVYGVRGDLVNGATGQISLRDDNNLVAEVGSSVLTTGVENGFAGTTPLQQWTSTLPGGLWDVWISSSGGGNGTFAKDGNAAFFPRNGLAIGDFTLIAEDPDLHVVCYLHNTSGSGSDHPTAGDTMKIILTFERSSTRKRVFPDSSYAWLIHLNQATGKLEYLNDDLDNTSAAWLAWESGVAASSFTLTADATITDAASRTFSFTSGWSTRDVIPRVTAMKDGVPYNTSCARELTGTANPHSGYLFDPTGLFK